MLMTPTPLPMDTVAGAFLFGFPTLFSIVNPLGSAIIFSQVTQDRTARERQGLAVKVSLYAAIVLLVSLWLGIYILGVFGISLGALRVAGGLVVAVSAWKLLQDPKKHEEMKAEHAAPAQGSADDVAFFPLTMPFTTGAGSIAVAIALASQRPSNGLGAASFFIGVSLAALAIAVLVLVFYRWSDRVVALLGARGGRIVSGLVAFLLLCVGVQVVSTGLSSLIAALHFNRI